VVELCHGIWREEALRREETARSRMLTQYGHIPHSPTYPRLACPVVMPRIFPIGHNNNISRLHNGPRPQGRSLRLETIPRLRLVSGIGHWITRTRRRKHTRLSGERTKEKK
jgi:hypothetical protein